MTQHSPRSTHAGSARAELDRVLTRLATLGPARLSRPVTPTTGPLGAAPPAPPAPGGSAGPTGAPLSPADLVRSLLQHLADVVADAQGRRERTVPLLADRAVADQLAVLAGDVLDLVEGADEDAAPRGADAEAAGRLAADVAARLRGLRRALP